MQRTHLEAYEESVFPTGCPDFNRASSKIINFTQQLKQSFGIRWGQCGKKSQSRCSKPRGTWRFKLERSVREEVTAVENLGFDRN